MSGGTRRRSRYIGLVSAPEPRLVVGDLYEVAIKELCAGAVDIVVVGCPSVEMNENTLDRLAISTGLVDHVNLLDIAKAQLLKGRLDTLPGDVGEDARNADAGVRSRQSLQLVDSVLDISRSHGDNADNERNVGDANCESLLNAFSIA